MSLRAIVVILAALLAVPTHAQEYLIPHMETAATLTTTPAYPSPHSTVRITLQSPLYTLAQGTISWSVNGEPQEAGEGLTSIDVPVGSAGEPITITASFVGAEGGATAETTLVPASVELIWEGTGYAPPFYRGRTLAAVGGQITLVAYTTFRRDGTRVNDSAIEFTWYRNGTVLGSQSGRGKSTITIDAPLQYGIDTIAVEARTADRALAASKSAIVQSIEPPLRLYVDHPLFGLWFNKPLQNKDYVGEAEITVSAVPYFAPIRSEHDPSITYEWRVNGAYIAPDPERRSSLTIDATGSDGSALIQLLVTHTRNYLFSTEAQWNLSFTKTVQERAQFNPFLGQ